MKAFAADSLVESIGVNRHGHYTDTNYKDFAKEKAALLSLGVRHVRDGFPAYTAINRDSFFYKNIHDLVASGIRVNMITTRAHGGNPETDFSKLSQYIEWCDGGVSALEGVNEPDVWGGNWASETRRLQKALFDAAKAQGIKLPILAPSIISKNSELGDVGAFVTAGNMHSYAGAGRPAGPLDGDVASKSKCWPGKPIYVTECGYHDAVKHTGGHKPVSEQAAGIYAPILFLEHFRRGFVRSFWYELLDQRAEPTLTNALRARPRRLDTEACSALYSAPHQALW